MSTGSRRADRVCSDGAFSRVPSESRCNHASPLFPAAHPARDIFPVPLRQGEVNFQEKEAVSAPF